MSEKQEQASLHVTLRARSWKTVKVTTDNPVVNSLLDALLNGENRRLLLVGNGSKKPMIGFTVGVVNRLETQLADARERVAELELALAISMVGKSLGVELVEEVKDL